MKLLTLVRHAKSSWSDESLRDFDRPLNARGQRDAPRMAAWLAQQKDRPELLISSSAKRALETAAFFAEALGQRGDAVRQEGNIYEAYVEDLRKVTEDLDDAIHHAALIGHNPGITEFAGYLTGSLSHHFPTGTVCTIELKIDSWQAVTSGIGAVRTRMTPKLLNV
jgi:phosphohistidine phosphatase